MAVTSASNSLEAFTRTTGFEDFPSIFRLVRSHDRLGCLVGFRGRNRLGTAVWRATFGRELTPVGIFGGRRCTTVALALFADVTFRTNDIDAGVTHALAFFAITAFVTLHTSTGVL